MLSCRYTRWFYASTAKSIRETIPTVETTYEDYITNRQISSAERGNIYGTSFTATAPLSEELGMESQLKASRSKTK